MLDGFQLDLLEKKLWNLYYALTGRKHQHELFQDMHQLSENQQREKIKNLALDFHYNNLYFADIRCYQKKYFFYSAQVLVLRGYPKIQDVIPELLMWMQDINWPGSYEIFQLLCTIPKDVFMPFFIEAVKKAYMEHDLAWMSWLYPFIEEFQIEKNEFQQAELFDSLVQYGNV